MVDSFFGLTLLKPPLSNHSLSRLLAPHHANFAFLDFHLLVEFLEAAPRPILKSPKSLQILQSFTNVLLKFRIAFEGYDAAVFWVVVFLIPPRLLFIIFLL